MRDAAVVDVVRQHAIHVGIDAAACVLLDAIDPRVTLVLVGEATHGALEPLEKWARHERDLPETYPTGV